MPSIKDYNVKLKSLRNTRKITKTMKMVSASKLRRAQSSQMNAKIYAGHLAHLTSRISAAVEETAHPLLTPNSKVKKALILVVTSDKGLCGAFNNNANKQVLTWLNQNRNHYDSIDISCLGKRGYIFFRRRANIKIYYESVTGNPKFADAIKIGQDISRSFINSEYAEVYITYNEFFSPLSQKTTFDKILPIDPSALIKKEAKEGGQYIFEPEQTRLLDFLIPHFLYFKIYFALLENSAGEHGARMSAMDNATKNASDLTDRYTLLRNRARQSEITTELTEIVAGAEALN